MFLLATKGPRSNRIWFGLGRHVRSAFQDSPSNVGSSQASVVFSSAHKSMACSALLSFRASHGFVLNIITVTLILITTRLPKLQGCPVFLIFIINRPSSKRRHLIGAAPSGRGHHCFCSHWWYRWIRRLCHRSVCTQLRTCRALGVHSAWTQIQSAFARRDLESNQALFPYPVNG